MVGYTEDAIARDEATTESKDDLAMYLRLKQWFKYDDDHSEKWRADCEKDYDFVAGDQWTEAAKKQLEDEGRPPLTFNFSQTFLRAIAGLEINNRTETTFIPQNVEEGDVVENEVLSQTSKWMGDECDAPDEQSESYMDLLTCGMGWTESRMDYEEEPDGKYIEDQLDPAEMRWDCNAKKKNIKDARRVHRVKCMSMEDAKALFPDADPTELDCPWAGGYDTESPLKPVEERRLKLENGEQDDDGKNEVRIVQTQWWEREPFYRVVIAGQDQEQQLSEEDYKKFAMRAEQMGMQHQKLKQYRRVYKEAFLGGVILKIGECPCPNRFTLQCMTGFRHKTKGTWFGLTKLMRDPNMNHNKWMSQALHILNSTAKGGILAEKGAFGASISEAQRTYASPDAITVVADGAISKSKIMAKPGTGMAGPYVQMMQYALEVMPKILGMSLEALGLRETQQANVLEQSRKQSSMTVLATLMNAKQRHQREVGRIRLYFIQHYIPEGTIIRLVGQDGMKAIRLIKDDKTMGRHDVIVSEAPTSSNSKEQTWAMLMQMIANPAIQSMLTPQVVGTFLDYCPLPSKLVNILKQMIASGQPMQQKKVELADADAQAKIEKTKADTEKSKGTVELDQAKAFLAVIQGLVAAQQPVVVPSGGEVTAPNPPATGAFGPPMTHDPIVIGSGVDPRMQLPQVPQLPEGIPQGMMPSGGHAPAMPPAAPEQPMPMQ